jgi:hypothetical protein
MLSFKEIKDLIDLVAERGLSALEVEQTGFRIRIEGAHSPSGNGAGALPGPPALPALAPAGTEAVPVAETEPRLARRSPRERSSASSSP